MGLVSDYLSSFDQETHNEVMLTVDGQKFDPEVVDYDFTITKVANSRPQAEIVIHNFDVTNYSSVKIECNKKTAFEWQQASKVWNNGIVSPSNTGFTTTLSIVVPALCLSSNIAAGDSVPYKIAGSNTTKQHTCSQNHIFSETDTPEGRVQRLVYNEDGLAKTFYLTSEGVYLVPKGGSKGKNFSLDARSIVLNAQPTFGSEQLVLTCLWQDKIEPLMSVRFKLQNEQHEKEWLIVGLKTIWGCRTGLVQVLTLITGKRLQQFLNPASKDNSLKGKK